MKKYLIESTLLIVFAIFGASLCAAGQVAPSVRSMSINGSVCYNVPPESSIAEASFVIARKMARYYSECTSNQSLQIKYSRLAADNGIGMDAYNYAQELATDHKEKESTSYFLLSARRGFIDGMYKLGSRYEQGVGIAADINEAVFWYTMAARQGEWRSARQLASILRKEHFSLASAWMIVSLEEKGSSPEDAWRQFESSSNQVTSEQIDEIKVILVELRANGSSVF